MSVHHTTAEAPAWKSAAVWMGLFFLFAAFIILNKDFNTFLRYLLLGLPQGAVIALIAVGYTMVYGIIQLINFAHGEVFMFSSYFVLMLIVPGNPFETAAPKAITLTIGLLVFCTAWVAAARLHNRTLRVAIAVVAACAVAAVNWRIMPIGGRRPLPFFAAYVFAIVYSCCLGVTMDLLAYRPLRHSPRLIPLITAIGLSLLFQNYAQALWGSASRYYPDAALPEVLKGERFQLGAGLAISKLDLIIMTLALALMASLQFFILRTRTGKAMRACAQDRTTAALMGINVNSVVALAFGLGAGLAAVVAPLYVVRGTPISPQMGYIVGILAFASAVLGGIGNITGAMLGGLVIGIIYSFVPLFDSLHTFHWFVALEQAGWVTREGYERLVSGFGRPGQYQLGVAYAFMILVIVFKPTGLLGQATAKRA